MRRGLRGAWPSACRCHDLRHDHRQVGPHALGPDRRGLLARSASPTLPPVHDRPQLRARREDMYPFIAEARRVRRPAYVSCYAERRPAQRARRLRRDPGADGRARRPARARAAWSTPSAAAAAPGRRTSPRLRASVAGVRPRAPRRRRSRARTRLSGLEMLQIDPTTQLCQRRRALQRHRLDRASRS
jgi:hypothetical protein